MLILLSKLADVLILVDSMRSQLSVSMVVLLGLGHLWFQSIQCFLRVWTGENGELGKAIMRVPAEKGAGCSSQNI